MADRYRNFALMVNFPEVIWKLLQDAARRRGIPPAQLALEISGGVLVKGSVEKWRANWGAWEVERRASNANGHQYRKAKRARERRAANRATCSEGINPSL
jgi:hypothetical protein